MSRAAVICAALLAVAALPSAATAAQFRTPGKAAYCDGIGNGTYREGFTCWTPNDGFTVWMDGGGRSHKGYDGSNEGWFDSSRLTLSFGYRWSWLGITCNSRKTGLTCKNHDGHGWWLGRYTGYRMF